MVLKQKDCEWRRNFAFKRKNLNIERTSLQDLNYQYVAHVASLKHLHNRTLHKYGLPSNRFLPETSNSNIKFGKQRVFLRFADATVASPHIIKFLSVNNRYF